MVCPYCTNEDTSVVDSRKNTDGSIIRRRRNCDSCKKRFTTYETAQIRLLVKKRNGELEEFNYEKLINGLNNACVDTGLNEEMIIEVGEEISTVLHSKGPEITSMMIGELVLQSLKELNEVAYMRFASVYKEFSEVSDFEKEAAELD